MYVLQPLPWNYNTNVITCLEISCYIPAGKVNNKDARTTSMASFWYLYCYFWTYFTPCSSVSKVNLEEANAGWDSRHNLHVAHCWKCWNILKLCETFLNSRVCKELQNLDWSLQSNFHESSNFVSLFGQWKEDSASYFSWVLTDIVFVVTKLIKLCC